MVIAIVVVAHVVTRSYGYDGDKLQIPVPPELPLFTQALCGVFMSFVQGFLMGLLFLISGYLVVGSYNRKGFKLFMKERLIRLGIPTLIYMGIIMPFNHSVFSNITWFDFSMGFLQLLRRFISGCGVMWYAETLLVFSFLYGIVRLLSRREMYFPAKWMQYSFRRAWGLIFIIAIFAFIIRQAFPIGVYTFGITLCYYSSYIVLFIIGIMAHRYNILEMISFDQGKRWLAAGLVLGIGGWLLVVYLGGVLEDGMGNFYGGLRWQCAVYAIWESFVAVSMCLGLIPVFREKLNYDSKFLRARSEDSFAVYLFHYPIILGAVVLFFPLELDFIVKMVIVSALCVPLCFAVSHYVFRRIPLLKKIL
jgi:hypothetical protein